MNGKEKNSEQLSAYLDGELSDEETRRVDEMLADDPALSDELESLRQVRQLLRGLPREQAPDGLLDTVLVGAQRRRNGRWVGRLARAAVIVLAVGIGVIVTARLNRPAQQNETQAPSPFQAPPLAKSGLTDIGRTAPGGVTNVLINTDNLVLTQREVEGVFGRNSIKPVVAKEAARVTKSSFDKRRSRANYYNQKQVAPNQIRYELAITDNQMRQIVAELNEIRARQVVSQSPVRHRVRNGDDTIALAKRDFRDKSPAGAEKAAEYAKMRRSAARRAGNEDAKKDGKHFAYAGKHKGTDSKPALAVAIPKPKTADTEQHKDGMLREQKAATHRQATTTLATANVRQLVVILNVVGE